MLTLVVGEKYQIFVTTSPNSSTQPQGASTQNASHVAQAPLVGGGNYNGQALPNFGPGTIITAIGGQEIPVDQRFTVPGYTGPTQ